MLTIAGGIIIAFLVICFWEPLLHLCMWLLMVAFGLAMLGGIIWVFNNMHATQRAIHSALF
jgi:hypothetical protein